MFELIHKYFKCLKPCLKNDKIPLNVHFKTLLVLQGRIRASTRFAQTTFYINFIAYFDFSIIK
jgi:hypothetical protein